jgi:hypothetical protein
MRIKSYFASSVQSAIATARKEFGDEVTLVTSHTAALESRHLGDYEVVFAVEEAPEPEAKLRELLPAKAEPVTPRKDVAQVIKAPAAAWEPVKTTVVDTAPPAPEPTAFKELLQEAIATPLSTEENLPEKLERVHAILIEMGIDGPMTRALMTMIERSVAIQITTQVSAPIEAEAELRVETAGVEVAEPETEPAVPAMPDLTPAELAFYLSVSVGS